MRLHETTNLPENITEFKPVINGQQYEVINFETQWTMLQSNIVTNLLKSLLTSVKTDEFTLETMGLLLDYSSLIKLRALFFVKIGENWTKATYEKLKQDLENAPDLAIYTEIQDYFFGGRARLIMSDSQAFLSMANKKESELSD